MDNYLSLLKTLLQEVNDWYELKKKFEDLIDSDCLRLNNDII